MDTVDLKLAQDCEALAVAASEGVTWLKDAAGQSPTVAQQAPSLVSELQKVRNQSRKLARAARRRMCVGVFGPSQAGKSYLVSILASRDGRPLQARFADRTYDFLREINPPGNRESTGLVTRFGLGLSDGPADFPVKVRLLTQTDIVKILGNSFLLDFDHQKAEFVRPDGAAIRKRLSELRAKAQPSPVGDLESDDVLDLIEYFDTFFAGVTAELRTDFWREAIDLAPRLSGQDRARLWSVLWYDFQPFTDLYVTLYDGLQKLNHAPEALLGMDALIPREKSIVDVLTLDRLGADADDPLLVRPRRADGRSAPDARLPRSLVCALTAELNVAIDEKPWDFFDHTDLLDFPGARSRLKLANLDDVAKTKGVAEGANPLRELLLRGKVAYLFQRYSAERELSAILLCIPDGNQEVRDLSDMMTAWIDQTIGATPADRAKQKNALFLVLTKMDREFEQKAGETEESRRLRWSARLGNSLVNNFRGEWPLDWNGKPFNNSFWLRNPTVIDERLMDYEGGREVGIADSFAQRAGELRRHFVENEDVRRHFADPALAWDEAFRANDGGVAHLVKSLIPVCDPAIKRAQVRGQLEIQLRRLVDRLAGFHSASDGDARTKKRDPRADGPARPGQRHPAAAVRRVGRGPAGRRHGLARDLFPHRHRPPVGRGRGPERQDGGRRGGVDRCLDRPRRHLRRRVRRGDGPYRAALRRARGPRRALRPRGCGLLAREHAPRRSRREGAVSFRRRPPASRLADRRADRGRAPAEADRPALPRGART
jgi:hypothetical protein